MDDLESLRQDRESLNRRLVVCYEALLTVHECYRRAVSGDPYTNFHKEFLKAYEAAVEALTQGDK